MTFRLKHTIAFLFVIILAMYTINGESALNTEENLQLDAKFLKFVESLLKYTNHTVQLELQVEALLLNQTIFQEQRKNFVEEGEHMEQVLKELRPEIQKSVILKNKTDGFKLLESELLKHMTAGEELVTNYAELLKSHKAGMNVVNNAHAFADDILDKLKETDHKDITELTKRWLYSDSDKSSEEIPLSNKDKMEVIESMSQSIHAYQETFNSQKSVKEKDGLFQKDFENGRQIIFSAIKKAATSLDFRGVLPYVFGTVSRDVFSHNIKIRQLVKEVKTSTDESAKAFESAIKNLGDLLKVLETIGDAEDELDQNENDKFHSSNDQGDHDEL